MMDGRSDEQLMASVAGGSREALAILVKHHYGPTLGYLFRLTGGNRPLAEDLVQETFAALLSRGGYEAGRPFKPWLYAIATNLARDHFKSAAVRHAALPGDELPETISTAPGPEEHALAAEQGREVAAAIGQMAEEYQVVLVLRFYQGLSLQEIAQALDVPLGTVKSRLSVGVRRLRQVLSQQREGACR
jgi:RNA polymerase sigma-70 factor, ECF subfamily